MPCPLLRRKALNDLTVMPLRRLALRGTANEERRPNRFLRTVPIIDHPEWIGIAGRVMQEDLILLCYFINVLIGGLEVCCDFINYTHPCPFIAFAFSTKILVRS